MLKLFRKLKAALALVTLVRLDRFANGSDGHLRRQPKAVPQLPVTAHMDGLLRKDVIRKADLGSIRRRSIEGVHRLPQRRMLLSSRDQLELQGQFHASKFRTFFIRSLGKPVGLPANRAFLYPLKSTVSSTEFL